MSELRRLFASAIPSIGATLALSPDAARHARVLRLREGERVVLFDGRGVEAVAQLTALGETGGTACIEERREVVVHAATVVLLQALPKGSKLEDIVRTTTEAGVSAIHLAIAERSIARPDESRAKSRLERLTKIAQEAARQSERVAVPEIVSPAPLLEAARRAPDGAARLVLSPRGGVPWADALSDAREVWLAVGPEGGLSPAEEAALEQAGWQLAQLALPVLRVETAAPVAVALTVDRLASR